MSDINKRAVVTRPADPKGSVLSRRLKVAVNPKLIDKNVDGDKSLFAHGWSNVALTPRQLAHKINRGMAYTCQLQGSRKVENFTCSDVVSVDFDGARRIEEVLEEPIVKRCMTIFYPSANHTPQRHRFRIVFALPRTIESPTEMRAVQRSLALRLGGDLAATDPARLFYGSKGSRPQVFDRCIDEGLLAELIAQGMDADQSDFKGGRAVPTISRQHVPRDHIIFTDDGQKVPFEDVEVRRAVFCPFHQDNNPSAFVLQSRGGAKGLHCSTCAQTFWAEQASPADYDFFDFEKTVHKVHEYFKQHRDLGPLRDAFPGDHPVHVGLLEANISISQSPYLHIDQLKPGISFIKSPKGSGKTERLKSLLADSSTLLIGHRVNLIGQSCARLGLEFYRDVDGPLYGDRVGVCLDSLERLQWRTGGGGTPVKTHRSKFDTIVIDESEQVFGHFLSETMNENRDKIFVIFCALLKNAKRVIAADADLSWLTVEVLTRLAGDMQPGKGATRRRTFVYLNEHQHRNDIEVYETEHHLLGDMMEQLSAGERVFATSNSKSRIDRIEAAVAETLSDKRVIKITSDSSKSAQAQYFLKSPSTESKKYDLILTSPSLGTGVDISFEGQEKAIDIVYGFFDAQITTHFDFDQQLARVRHPGAVRVWVSPRTFRFDTALDVVRTHIMHVNAYKNFLMEFDEFNRPVYDEADPFLHLAAHVVSQQRASKNNLKRHFIELKRHQGYDVRFVAPDDDTHAVGSALATVGRQLSHKARIDRLMNAAPLSKPKMEEVKQRISDNELVSDEERSSVDRTWVELFYREPITRALLERDANGQFRQKVLRFERIRLKTKNAHEHANLVGDLRTAVQVIGADRLNPRTRFVRSGDDETVLLYHLLHKTPLMVDGAWRPDATLTSADLREFADAMKDNKAIVENVLDVEVRGDVATKPVRQLNEVLKLLGQNCGLAERRKVNGAMNYKYALDKRLLKEMTAVVDRRAATNAWEVLYSHHQWDKTELNDLDQGDRRPSKRRRARGTGRRVGSAAPNMNRRTIEALLA